MIPTPFRPSVYICAPYGAADPLLREWNTERACALARLAARETLAPLCVHPMIVPIHGEDSDPAQRAAGMACSVAMVRLVARTTSGQLWALLRNDGTASDGMLIEWKEWQASRALTPTPTFAAARNERAAGLRVGTWQDWRQAFNRAGLLALWSVLEDPPLSAFDRWHDRVRAAAEAQS